MNLQEISASVASVHAKLQHLPPGTLPVDCDSLSAAVTALAELAPPETLPAPVDDDEAPAKPSRRAKSAA